MWKRLLVVLSSAGALLATGATPASAAVCADHPNQRSAQIAKDTRDADGDGVYCEALPCPCLKPGQESGSGSKPAPVKRKPSVKKPKPKPARKAPKRAKPTPKPKYVAPRELRGVRITSVMSGDTVRAQTRNGGYLAVKLLGIEAPENPAIEDEPSASECGGLAAAEALETFRSEFPDVVLVTDPSQERYDRHGRLLAYVEPADETTPSTYQAFMLQQGWAKLRTERPPLRRFGQFDSAQELAVDAGSGIWGACGGDVHRPLLPASPVGASDRAGDRTIVHTDRGIDRVGSWKIGRDGGRVRDLVRVWGLPDIYSDCVASWDELGVSVGTFGYATAGGCSRLPRAGSVKYFEIYGDGWRTSRGLAIGDVSDRVYDLYPDLLDSGFTDEDDTTIQPLTGYLLGGPDGPVNDDVSTEWGEADRIERFFVTLIFGA